MKYFIKVFLTFIFFLSLPKTLIFAQDERQFRQFFSPELPQGLAPTFQEKKYLYEAESPFYEYDLNQDSSLEFIKISKKDGLDFISLYDKNVQKIFEEKLPCLGSSCWMYRILISEISANTRLLLIYFFEGESGNIQKTATSRLYFLTIENLDLKNCYLFKGPQFETEIRGFPDTRYALRQYHVEIKDINGDKNKDVILEYAGKQRIYIYKSKGEWSTI